MWCRTGKRLKAAVSKLLNQQEHFPVAHKDSGLLELDFWKGFFFNVFVLKLFNMKNFKIT